MGTTGVTYADPVEPNLGGETHGGERDFFAYLVGGTGFALTNGQLLLSPAGTSLPFYSALPSTILGLARQEAAFVG